MHLRWLCIPVQNLKCTYCHQGWNWTLKGQSILYILITPGRHKEKKKSFDSKKSILFSSSEPTCRKKWFGAWYSKPRQACTWSTLAQFSQHSYLAKFSQKCPVVVLGPFRQYSVLGPLWPSLVNILKYQAPNKSNFFLHSGSDLEEKNGFLDSQKSFSFSSWRFMAQWHMKKKKKKILAGQHRLLENTKV